MSRNQPGRHFLLSAAARTLSLAKVMRMTDDQAFDAFKAIRWAPTNGAPLCPRCGCVEVYAFATSRRFKCKACGHKFSVTSGTIFASRKMGAVSPTATLLHFGAMGPNPMKVYPMTTRHSARAAGRLSL
ncbi:MAG: putative transposase [Caulobacteraceae bacterium]|nr:putative transposase [Caulobacteraceae bacterium]